MPINFFQETADCEDTPQPTTHPAAQSFPAVEMKQLPAT